MVPLRVAERYQNIQLEDDQDEHLGTKLPRESALARSEIGKNRYQSVQPGAHLVRENGTTSEVEDVTTRSLETLDATVEVRSFVVQLVNASAEAPQVGNEVGIVLQHVAHSVEVRAGFSVQAGLANEVQRDREGDGVTHNRHYVTQGPEATPVSGPRST